MARKLQFYTSNNFYPGGGVIQTTSTGQLKNGRSFAGNLAHKSGSRNMAGGGIASIQSLPTAVHE
jgi:hypothetical protein